MGIDHLAISVVNNTATAKIRQSYRADDLNVNGRKTPEPVRSNGQGRSAKKTFGG